MSLTAARRFFLGCAVWSCKDWVGELYPLKSRPTDFLRLYSRRLTAVEGNTTFYAVPDQRTIARWAAETPPSFAFCLKLPRELTHQGLLQPAIPGALRFVRQMQGLGDRLGPFFAQLPPQYGPDLLPDLTAFLSVWPHSEAPLAVEVRHSEWFQESNANALTGVLEKFGVGRVLLDSRPIYSGPNDPRVQTERRKPKLPLQPTVTAPFAFVRFISHPESDVNTPFLNEWGTRLDHWLRQGTHVYFFVHCPIEMYSPGTARRFQHLLEHYGVPVPPLPWDTLAPIPTQARLF